MKQKNQSLCRSRKVKKNLLMAGVWAFDRPREIRYYLVWTWWFQHIKESFRIGLQHAGRFQEYGFSIRNFFYSKITIKSSLLSHAQLSSLIVLEKKPGFRMVVTSLREMTHLDALFFFSSCGRGAGGEPHLERLCYYARHDANGSGNQRCFRTARVTLRALVIF